MMDDDKTISPRQCRAARVWLDMTQREMARQASIDMQTLMYFELGRGTPRRATVLALMLFFQEAGIKINGQQNLILPP
jgi:DNA-binding XRE family transcriptional regulator